MTRSDIPTPRPTSGPTGHSDPTEGADTMRAVVHDTYGTSDVLHLSEVARPTIKDNEVLVRVHAAGLDRSTWHLMTGRPYAIRLGFGFRGPKNPVIGRDIAGTVETVGSAVTRFAVGDAVFGIGNGSFAEYTAAREDKLAPKPDNVTFEQAGVVAISALTAFQAVRDAGRVETGQKVLVIGASGGVGSYTVQMAKALGAEVIGVASTAKLDLVRSLGADHVLDYTRDDSVAGPERYDLILDMGGNPSLTRLRRALAPNGTALMVGGEEGGNLTGGMDRQLRGAALSVFSGKKLSGFMSKERGTVLEDVADLLDGWLGHPEHRPHLLPRPGIRGDAAAGGRQCSRQGGHLCLTLGPSPNVPRHRFAYWPVARVGQARSMCASSPREVTPVLVNTRRWNATVRGDTQHWAAASLFDRPWLTSSATCSSIGVRFSARWTGLVCGLSPPDARSSWPARSASGSECRSSNVSNAARSWERASTRRWLRRRNWP